MKKLVAVLFLLTLFACKGQNEPADGAELTEEDKKDIMINLTMMKLDAAHQYRVAEMNERQLLEAKHYGLPKAKIEAITKAHMDSFAKAWNNPYHISKDSTVTLEKYLSWCKEHGDIPKEYHKQLRPL